MRRFGESDLGELAQPPAPVGGRRARVGPGTLASHDRDAGDQTVRLEARRPRHRHSLWLDRATVLPGWQTTPFSPRPAAWRGWAGDPAAAPTPPPRQQATQLAGTHAAIAAMLGLAARRRTGKGQLVEVSAQEAVAATLETGAISWIHAGTSPHARAVCTRTLLTVSSLDVRRVRGGWLLRPRPHVATTCSPGWLEDRRGRGPGRRASGRTPSTAGEHRPHVDAVVARFVRPAAYTARRSRARVAPGRCRGRLWTPQPTCSTTHSSLTAGSSPRSRPRTAR